MGLSTSYCQAVSAEPLSKALNSQYICIKIKIHNHDDHDGRGRNVHTRYRIYCDFSY